MTKTHTVKPKTCTKDKSNLTLQALNDGPTGVDMPLNKLVMQRRYPRVMVKALDCRIIVSSNSSRAITFTFGLMPLGKGMNPLILLAIG